MITKVALLITLSFLTGGCAMLMMGIKNKDLFENKERWVKFFVYLLIVNAVVFTIQYHSMIRYLSVVIVLMGFSELIYVWRKEELKPQLLINSLFVFLLIGSLFIAFAFCMEADKQLLLYLFVFLFDGFSQVTGQLFGKRKLSQRISPNKSIEGATGGFISILITSFFVSGEVYQTRNAYMICIPLLIGLFALSGDLLASYYKRKCSVKDYSNLIPGHGGILDRFDSFIFSGAIFWLIS